MGIFPLPSPEKLETLTLSCSREPTKEELNEASLMTTPASNVRLLPLAAILAEFKLHKTTIYGLIKRGKFPRPVKIGGSSRWLADEIENYKAECRASR